MPQFVVLTHDHPFLHWDLMLETGAELRTWRLLALPVADRVEAEPLPNHRKLYLDYEGPLSGARGCVTRWDRGQFRLVEEADDRLCIELVGEKLCGVWSLVRSDAGQWTFERR